MVASQAASSAELGEWTMRLGSPAMPDAITGTRITEDLRALGVRPGGVVMVHTRMSALGWVIGGSGAVVQALLDALGPEGTLVAYASWAEHVYHAEDWPAEHRAAYLADPPSFDVATGEIDPDYGRIPERVRTWPGAVRSRHPEASVVAVGPRAGRLCAEHHDDDGYGTTSPFARIVEAGGQVLMLGAPLDTVTLLHHAEAIADVPGKRRVTYQVRVAGEDRTYTDIDTSLGALHYDALGLTDDPFAVIASSALQAAIGVRGRVGAADCVLFAAPELVAFAVAWMEERFGALRTTRAARR
jgi:aminoglycoside 3-N-acetyltransferase